MLALLLALDLTLALVTLQEPPAAVLEMVEVATATAALPVLIWMNFSKASRVAHGWQR